jgi:hypothetical protein
MDAVNPLAVAPRVLAVLVVAAADAMAAAPLDGWLVSPRVPSGEAGA